MSGAEALRLRSVAACRLCCDTGNYRGITGKHNYCACDAGEKIFAAEVFAPERLRSMNRLEQIAWLIRRNAENYASRHGYSKTLKHLCGITSAALLVALKREGFTAQMALGYAVNGYYHVWVVHKRRIIDPTFTQFDRNAPRVLFTDKTDKRYHAERVYRTPRRVATSFSQYRWEKEVALMADVSIQGEMISK